jgi:hypothetical protein
VSSFVEVEFVSGKRGLECFKLESGEERVRKLPKVRLENRTYRIDVAVYG